MVISYENPGPKISSSVFGKNVWIEPDLESLKKDTDCVMLLANQNINEETQKKFTDAALLIASPGEYENGGLFTYALGHAPVSYVVLADYISIAIPFCGKDGVETRVKEELQSADIILFDFHERNPWGTIDDATLVDVLLAMVRDIEPRVCIVVDSKGMPAASKLLHGLGWKQPTDPVEKFKILKKDLPTEDMLVVALDRV
jgi:hypothetical protein